MTSALHAFGDQRPPIALRSPADLIAATPYLLGFHPTDSVVVVGFRDDRLTFVARGDLPDPGTPPETAAAALLELVSRQEIDAIVLVGYGPDEILAPLVDAVDRLADERGVPVRDVLRVDSGRWWSPRCADPGCCPPGGQPVDHTTREISARLTFEGLVAAPSRGDRAREVAPVGDPAPALARAGARFSAFVSGLPRERRASALLIEGTDAVRAAVSRYAAGGVLDDDEVAWLGVLLCAIPVRDAAWRSITATQPHLRLWADVTRRVDPSMAAAPASLLAFTAWRAGDGVLARLAVDRALDAEPSYSMARLLRDALRLGVPPTAVDGWGTPEWDLLARDRLGEAAREEVGNADRPGTADSSGAAGREDHP